MSFDSTSRRQDAAAINKTLDLPLGNEPLVGDEYAAKRAAMIKQSQMIADHCASVQRSIFSRAAK